MIQLQSLFQVFLLNVSQECGPEPRPSQMWAAVERLNNAERNERQPCPCAQENDIVHELSGKKKTNLLLLHQNELLNSQEDLIASLVSAALENQCQIDRCLALQLLI